MKKKKVKNKSDINVSNKISKKRIGSILIVIVIFMLALLARVGYLQFVDGNRPRLA